MTKIAVLAVAVCLLAGCAQTSVTIAPGGRITGAGKMLGGSEEAVAAIKDAMIKACEPGRLEWWNNGENGDLEDPFVRMQLAEQLMVSGVDVQQIADVYQVARNLLASHSVNLKGRCVENKEGKGTPTTPPASP